VKHSGVAIVRREMQRRELLALGTVLLGSAMARSVRADVPVAAEGEVLGRELGSSIQASYARLPAFRLHFVDRYFVWSQRGRINVAPGTLSVVWANGFTTRLDGEHARSYGRSGALLFETAVRASQLHTLAACLGGATPLAEAFSLERADDAPLRPGQPHLLVLSATPRDAQQPNARTVLFVDPHGFRVHGVRFREQAGSHHRVDFTRLEAR
jgi:hypothetical protein